MALDDSHNLAFNTTDTPDLLIFNPFADSDEVNVLAPVADSKPNAQDPLRRRNSGSRAIGTSALARHVRSRTETYARNTRSPGIAGHLHPLRSAGLITGPGDAGVTRPHLARMVNVGMLVDAPPVEPDDSSVPPTEEKEVLVHEIKPADSLAGVSLKYGITMADLRRANHLWASDSIHMRTVLYIPINEASRLRKLETDRNLLSITPAEEVPNPMESMSEHPDSQESQLSRQLSDTIRRVPASHLSFFPPPSIIKSIPPGEVSPSPHHPPHVLNKASHAHYSSSPSHSLTSLLTALPIAASTRDTIIARLSFDSTSSSYSDRESEADSLNELELDDVRHARRSRDLIVDDVSDVEGTNTYSMVTPKATYRIPRIGESDMMSQPPSPTRRSHLHARHLSSSPQAYIPSHPQIRTVQMEPSPGMQLPFSNATMPSSMKGKGRARKDLKDFDFELGSTSSAT